MEFWSPPHFASVTQGRWLSPVPALAAALTGISIDTRTLKPGDVFFAIRGEQHDGHDHVAKAIELGAAMVVVEKEISDFGFRIADLASVKAIASFKDDPRASSGSKSEIRNPKSQILLVPDTVRALQQLASSWRDELRKNDVKVIAVTGSNGKTTTRNLIHAALSSTLRGTQSPKSFNNHLGVPLTLLAAKAEDDFVVAEVGTNHPGEIAALAAILRPNVAVITNIGTAHIGMFGSKEAIAAEKSSLYRFIEPGGTAVVNGTQPFGDAWRRDVVPQGVRVVTFGQKHGCDVSVRGGIAADATGLRFTLDSGVSVSLPLLGQHNVDNTLAAIAVSRALGVDDEAAAKSLAKMAGVEMRMQVIRIGARGAASGLAGVATGVSGGVTLIADCYNANPDSMRSALSTLAAFTPPVASARKIAVLGDMLELGEESPAEHRRVGDMLVALNQGAPGTILQVVLIGTHMARAAEQLAGAWPEGSCTYFDKWTDDIPARVAALLEANDIVLLKGSRGLRLERIVPALERRFSASPQTISVA